MKAHDPVTLTPQEWDEVATVPEVRNAWGLISDDAGAALQSFAYGAKFHIVSGGPGFVGDVFVIADDALAGAPFVLVRDDDSKALRVARF